MWSPSLGLPVQVGCWDGTVALWRLQPGEGLRPTGGRQPATPVLLMHMKADPMPLRAVAWAPPSLAGHAPGGMGRNIFLTAGHSGVIAIWDAR